MTTRTDIINDALEHLGEPPSSGDDDNSTWVTRIRNALDREARKLFEIHPWNFAKTTVLLSAADPTPIGWTYGYTKPPQCWRIIKVAGSTDPKADSIAYDDSEGRILANNETAYLTYVKGTWLTSMGAWPAVFAGALSAELAWKVCNVTGVTESRKEEIRKAAKRSLLEAKTWDGQQSLPEEIPFGSYVRARSSGLRSSRG